MTEKFLLNFSPNNSCISIFWPKNDQKIENFSNCFDRNRFRMVQNAFRNENIECENVQRFFQRHSRFLEKLDLGAKKWNAEIGKGTYMCDSFKNPQKYF